MSDNDKSEGEKCETCLIGRIVGLLESRGEDSAAEVLLCAFCLTCADCDVPSLSHNYSMFHSEGER